MVEYLTGITLDESRRGDLIAQEWLPGGVTGLGRRSMPHPIRFKRANAQYLTDVDENQYLDLHGGFGTAILGYAHPEVDEAAIRAIKEVGTFVGLPNPYESELAGRLVGLIPGVEMVALCGGGGSDACYQAVRVARAATGRKRIVKVEGGYHGWHSDLGVSTQHQPPESEDGASPGRPVGIPNSAGSLPEVVAQVDIVSVNDEDALRSVFTEKGAEIAAVMIEPILYSAGCILVDHDYLALARALCDEYGAILIYDEVMTGFRNGLAGAGALAGVVPDLGAFGKAVANGYMISFLGGRRDLIELLAPTGPVYYSGTFNGHPISCIAAIKTLEVIESNAIEERLNSLTGQLVRSISGSIDRLGVRAVCQGAGGVWSLYLGIESVRSYRDVFALSPEWVADMNERFRWFLLQNGIYMHRRHVNRCFLSASHTVDDVDRIAETVDRFLESEREEIPAT